MTPIAETEGISVVSPVVSSVTSHVPTLKLACPYDECPMRLAAAYPQP